MRYREFHYRWEWPLRSSPEALWPYVSDTDRFNRATGVPPVRALDAPGAPLTNERRRLSLTLLGVPIEWEEEPFEWVRPHHFGVNRRYATGPMAEMRVRAEMRPRPEGGTDLTYEVWARPRNPLGLAAIPAQIGVLSARRFAQEFQRCDRLAEVAQRAARPTIVLGDPAPLAPGGAARLGEVAAHLRAAGCPDDLSARLIELIERGEDLALAHIRPYALADAWGAPRQTTVETCLHATRAGLLDMQWEVLCPLCRGAKRTARSLGEVQSQMHCEVCHIDFSVNFDRAVELTFRPNPAIRAIDAQSYCVGGPQVTPHIVVQQLLAPGAAREVAPALEPGRYRARAVELGGGQFIQASPSAPEAFTLRASDGGWPEGEAPIALRPALRVENATAREQLIMLERMAWSDQAATAADVISLQAFRDLFAAEALRPGEQIEVGSVTIVFTDLRGSTQLYRQIGDAPAFGRVMDHFAVLRGAIAVEGGAIVKTIGDAVMASFRRPLPALRAMATAQQALANAATPLVLKVGLHHGPCIAVTLSDRLDYFGTTVNVAARIQHLSEGGDIVMSDAVYRDAEVRAWLEGDGAAQYACQPFQAALRGIDGPAQLWRATRTGSHP